MLKKYFLPLFFVFDSSGFSMPTNSELPAYYRSFVETLKEFEETCGLVPSGCEDWKTKAGISGWSEWLLTSLRKFMGEHGRDFSTSQLVQKLINIVSPSEPTFHYYLEKESDEPYLSVKLNVDNLGRASQFLYLRVPQWTPGSYKERDYAGNIDSLSLENGEGEKVSYERINKNMIRIRTDSTKNGSLRMSYRVFMQEPSVRTSYLGLESGWIIPASVFLEVLGFQSRPVSFEFHLPAHRQYLQTFTPSATLDDHDGKVFHEPNFDALIDSHIHYGKLDRLEFSVSGVPHYLVTEGLPIDEEFVKSLKKGIEISAKIMGGLPYSEPYYIFTGIHSNGSGGLEHRQSQFNLVRNRLVGKEGWQKRVLRLMFHEHFHSWNVKRLKPKEVVEIDYGNVASFETLWFVEGATRFFDTLVTYKSGVYTEGDFFDALTNLAADTLNRNGLKTTNLSDASYQAALKLYHHGPNELNSVINYYSHGAYLVLYLDLLIRKQSRGKRSFENVMRVM